MDKKLETYTLIHNAFVVWHFSQYYHTLHIRSHCIHRKYKMFAGVCFRFA